MAAYLIRRLGYGVLTIFGVLLLAADDPQGLVRLARLPEHHFSEEDLRRLTHAARERGGSALAALYDTLSDDQKKKADELLTGMGCMM